MLAKKTDRLVTISDRLKTELSEKFQIASPGKFATIELGLPLERFLHLPEQGQFRKQFKIESDAILIGTLGRLVPIKNHRRMLAVFSELVRRRPIKDVRLIIGGTGPMENELRQLAKELDVNDKVYFAGLVSDLPHFYADIDIALLTSDNEGTPVTLIEAQAAGKWVVAPNVGGIADVLSPQTGSLISSNEISAYLDVLWPIVEKWPVRASVTETNRSAVVERFSPVRLADNIECLYKILLNKSA
jgi:glycosyltransferase involved in cell wall biosynthesis